MLTHVAMGLWVAVAPLITLVPYTAVPCTMARHRHALLTVRVVVIQGPGQGDAVQPAVAPRGGGAKKKEPAGSPVPEPGVLAVVGTGLLALSLYRRKRPRHNARVQE